MQSHKFRKNTRLNSLFRRLHVDSKSLGMSHDYFIAFLDLVESLDFLADLSDNPTCYVLPTSAPKFLTAPPQNAKPDAAHLVAEPVQTRAVSRYRMIVEPPPNH